jgi:hypothetical protein
MKKILMFFLFVLLLPTAALASPIISCHCFQDRSFNPARPAAADPYLLATTQNSLFAVNFGLEKRMVVREKMSGVPGERLWVAHYLAERGGMPPALLFATHDRRNSWQATAALLNTDLGVLAPRFAALLAEDAGDGPLAAAVVDEIVMTRLGIPQEEVEEIRARGGSNAELILAAYLGRRGGGAAADLHAEVASGRATWGQLFNSLPDTAGTIEEDIRRLVE